MENHYNFIYVYGNRSSKELEQELKSLSKDDTRFIDVCGEKVYIPSPNFQALFLIRHAAGHFAAGSISLRQVLDWAFFVQKHTKEIEWKWLVEVLERYHIKDFYCCLNAICVEDLGFSISIFPAVQFIPGLKDRVLNDILYPQYNRKPPINDVY